MDFFDVELHCALRIGSLGSTACHFRQLAEKLFLVKQRVQILRLSSASCRRLTGWQPVLPGALLSHCLKKPLPIFRKCLTDSVDKPTWKKGLNDRYRNSLSLRRLRTRVRRRRL